MATVTKMKAAVNNKNLPILGSDGNLHNYYVGKWQNMIVEKGYNPTADEINALDAFVEAGINDGWINKVLYLLPFIGSESTPLTGIVPLIDNIADYNLAVSTVDGNLFSYLGGKIKSFGGTAHHGTIDIPIKTSDFGVTQAFAPYININYLAANGDDEIGIKGGFASAEDANHDDRFGIRKGAGLDSLMIGIGRDYSVEGSGIIYSGIQGTDYSEDCQLGVFGGLFSANSSNIMKRYVCKKILNSVSVLYDSMNGVSLTGFPSEECNIMIGSWTDRNLTTVVNLMAFFKPQNLTSADMYSFNQAVFALTTALGRDIPTT